MSTQHSLPNGAGNNIVDYRQQEHAVSTQHSLPDGSTTESDQAWVVAWRRFSEPLCAALNATALAFDPGVTFLRTAGGRRHIIELDTETVQLLNAALAKKAGP